MNILKNISMTKKITAGILALTFAAAFAVSAASPGSADDPLISKSYVDSTVIPYVDKVSTFTVISVPEGSILIGDAGCELILRMGTATVVATEKGGLCDTTIGGDWPTGSEVPANHNLIVPLSDGRGIVADTDIVLMVKGSYSFK